MTLQEWLAHIEQLHPAEIQLGLERVARVAEAMHCLPLPGLVIVVAGTNGKGSTVALIDQLAQAAGYTTGVYTSPHLQRFNERICMNGTLATDSQLCQAFEAVETARLSVAAELTYFEFTTLAALWLFGRQSADVYILEVGLGGRLDAVNIVDADVALITSIGLDHTDWLGDNLDLIAAEKVGIRRPRRPLVFAGEVMPPVIAQLCEADQVPLYRAGQQFSAQPEFFWQSQDGDRVHCSVNVPVPLGADNLVGAVQALALVKRLDASVIKGVAARARLPGRRQSVVISGVEWILDVGHNTEALARFAGSIVEAKGDTYALVAMLADKPAEKALAPFVSLVSHWYLAGLPGERGQSAATLRHCLLGSMLVEEALVEEWASVADAVSALQQTVQFGDRVLVFGSFYTVAEAATALAIKLE